MDRHGPVATHVRSSVWNNNARLLQAGSCARGLSAVSSHHSSLSIVGITILFLLGKAGIRRFKSLAFKNQALIHQVQSRWLSV